MNQDSRDLLHNNIDDTTFEIICDVLSKTSDQRNGYFHKDNIDDWSKVERARDLAFILFYFFLGAYSFSTLEKASLGIDFIEKRDDYSRLLAYVQRICYDNDGVTLPVIYLNKSVNKNDYWLPCFDKNVSYNELGEPQYSGLYLCQKGEKGNSLVFTKESMPESIYEGAITLRLMGEFIEADPTGPLKMIFCKGVFLLK